MDTPKFKIDGKRTTVTWGQGNTKLLLCAFSDPDHKSAVAEARTINRSGKANSQVVNLEKNVRVDETVIPGTYYFVAVAYGETEKEKSEPVCFEWTTPEIIANSPTPPNESSVPSVAPPKVEEETVPPTPTPAPVPPTPKSEEAPPEVKIPPPAGSSKPTLSSDTNRILTTVLAQLYYIEATQKLWAEKNKKGTFIPTEQMLQLMEQDLKKIEQLLLGESDPRFDKAKKRRHDCEVQLKEIRKISESAKSLQQQTYSAHTEEVRIPAMEAPPPKEIKTSLPATGHASTQADPPTPDLLSGRVGELERGLGDLGAEVGEIKGRVTDIGGRVDGLNTDVRAGIASLSKAIAGLRVPPTAPSTSPPAQPPPPPPSGGGSGTRSGGGQASTTPPPSDGGKSWWKNARGPICFLAFVLGLVLGLVTLVTVYFHADRSQTLDAERSNAAGVRSQANAEIDSARRIQVEAIDKLHGLQQEVEGMRRQQQVAPPTPPQPAPTPAPATVTPPAPVQPTNSSTTNVVKQLAYIVEQPEIVVVKAPPVVRFEPASVSAYETGYWSPTPMMNRYGYDKQGFDGYRYPGGGQ